MMEEPVLQSPRVLSPCSSSGKRRSNNDSNSPEFEFWMVRNPSFPQPNILSADELFSDGVLLPLHLLHNHSSQDPPDQNENPPEKPTEPETSESSQPGSRPEISSVLTGLSATTITSSKLWKDIFKISDRRSSRGDSVDDNSSKEKGKEKKKEKKISGGGGGGGNSNGVSAAELNINLWPFSRSRSAGNGGSRPRMAAAGATRKVSSAPCSRSNSAGESKSRKWPSSPSRGGVHLGRSSPVWQVRRGAGGSGGKGSDLLAKNAEKGIKREVNEVRRKMPANTVTSGGAAAGTAAGVSGAKAKVLNFNVPMCIGYKHNLSCRSDENSAVSAVTEAAGGGDGVGGVHRGGGGSDEGVRGSSLFNIRSLFTKKCINTFHSI